MDLLSFFFQLPQIVRVSLLFRTTSSQKPCLYTAYPGIFWQTEIDKQRGEYWAVVRLSELATAFNGQIAEC